MVFSKDKDSYQIPVGKMSGEIDPTNISRIESGRTNPTIFTLFRIAEALEIPLKDLFSIEPIRIWLFISFNQNSVVKFQISI